MTEIARALRAAGCVFAEDEARLLHETARTPAELAELVERRVGGEPVEHLLGWVEFCGLRVGVAPGVFVPRRRTELLAREAAARAEPGAVVVELCCGAGAVAAVIRNQHPGAEVYAADLDPAAVAVARRNLGTNVYQGDLYAPLPPVLRGRVDVLVANAPYVPTNAIELMPPEARLHEPPVALDGGVDGLDVLRRVAAGAPDWLAPAGALLVETSQAQARELAAVFTRYGLAARVAHDDDLDATVLIGDRR